MITYAYQTAQASCATLLDAPNRSKQWHSRTVTQSSCFNYLKDKKSIKKHASLTLNPHFHTFVWVHLASKRLSAAMRKAKLTRNLLWRSALNHLGASIFSGVWWTRISINWAAQPTGSTWKASRNHPLRWHNINEQAKHIAIINNTR